MYFAFDPTLFGYSVWARPTLDDVRDLLTVLESELDRPPHAALVDFEGLTYVDADAFQALSHYTVQHQKTLARIVSRATIVRPPGVNGAIVSGFFEVASRPFPVEFHQHVESALAGLGRTDVRACGCALEHARAEVSGEPILLRRIREYLSSHIRAPDPTEAAASVRLSTRTLQRRLAEHGTGFSQELRRIRLRQAERRLLETHDPVTDIALDLGFKSSQHFAVQFRQSHGCTPSEFRARGIATEPGGF